MKTKAQPKKTKASKISVVIGFFLMVFLIVGSVFLYHQHTQKQAIAKERAQYAQAEKDLDVLMQSIVAKLGTPINSRQDKSCGHTSAEFSEGDLFCGVGDAVIYDASNLDEAKNLTQKTYDLINESPVFKSDTDIKASLEMSKEPTPVDIASLNLKGERDLTCLAGFKYYVGSDISGGYKDFPAVVRGGLQIGLSCGSRPALAAYYPLKD